MHILGNPEVIQVKLRVPEWRSVGAELHTEYRQGTWQPRMTDSSF